MIYESPKDSESGNDISDTIEALFERDQADREATWVDLSEKEREELLKRDRDRLAVAKEVYEKHQENLDSLSADALYKLAILFQHGRETEDYVRAYQLSKLAYEKRFDKAGYLMCAAEDRKLISQGEQQKWGTQFTVTDDGIELDPVAPESETGITDDMRREYGIFTRREELKEKYNKGDE